MEEFFKNDLIEHWEYGVGKISAIDDEAVTINFKNHGSIVHPIERSASLTKLNPKGFLAQLYKNEGNLRELIAQESTEIIKLLIADESKSKSGRIERDRIKKILTKGKPEDRGWQKKFWLIEDNGWSKWWKKVNDKLIDDVWFNTTSKSEIILRQKPVSQLQNKYELFLFEKLTKKKLDICESLIKILKIGADQAVVDKISHFLSDVIIGDYQKDLIHFAVFISIQLSEKGAIIEIFDNRANELILDVLFSSKLPSKKLLIIYSYLNKRENQNITDHLIIFTLRDKRLRNAVKKNLTTNIKIKDQLKSYEYEKSISDEHINALNSYKSIKKDSLEKTLIELSEEIDDKCVASFFSHLLLLEKSCSEIRDTVSRVVIKQKLTIIIYTYLNKVHLDKVVEIPYILDFFKFIGSENTDRSLAQILLSKRTASERPLVFLSALISLVTQALSGIDDSKKQSLINHASALLKNELGDPQFDNLKIQISKNAVAIPELKIFAGLLRNDDFVKLVKDRSNSRIKRLDAVKTLIKKGLIKECHSIAKSLLRNICIDDFILIEEILLACPKDKIGKDFVINLLEAVNNLDRDFAGKAAKLIITTDAGGAFIDTILLDGDEDWHKNHRETVKEILRNETLSKITADFALRKILFNHENPAKILDRFSFYCEAFIKFMLEEIRNLSMEEFDRHKKKIEEKENDFLAKLKKDAKVNEEKLIDAIDRTNQRYEEYLGRLMPNLNELKEVESALRRDFKIEKPSISILTEKIVLIRENIEGLLKLLGVIARD